MGSFALKHEGKSFRKRGLKLGWVGWGVGGRGHFINIED